MRDELMSEIIKLEWDMFSHVSNVGGPASCQMRPDTFKIMRKSQAATWSDELLASYLEDLKTATREGRNIMTEKYARMMESTFPEEYRKLAASLPSVDKETLQKIEEIVAINVGWKAELFDRYPRLSGKGRPLRTSEDSAMETSFETYLRGELKTYSARTITLLHELTLRQQQDRLCRTRRCPALNSYNFSTIKIILYDLPVLFNGQSHNFYFYFLNIMSKRGFYRIIFCYSVKSPGKFSLYFVKNVFGYPDYFTSGTCKAP